MDDKIQIKLNSTANVESVNVDTYKLLELSNNRTNILEYDITEVVNAADLFIEEREKNEVYRIYGRLEYLSLLNGLKNNYRYFSDFLGASDDSNRKDIFNSFDFYLVKPSTVTKITGDTSYVDDNPNPVNGVVLNENFDNWVTATPTNYPVDWEVSLNDSSYLEKTPTNQLKFVVGNNPYFNAIWLWRHFDSLYGFFTVEFTFNCETQTVIKLLSSTTSITNEYLIDEYILIGSGSQTHNINVTSNNPLKRILIITGGYNNVNIIDNIHINSDASNNSSETEQVVHNPYIRNFEVIATPDDFNLFNAGFSNNVFNEQIYGFVFSKDFDISNTYDGFGFPLTELFIYAKYKPKLNISINDSEPLLHNVWNINGDYDTLDLDNTALNIGDIIDGDVVDYSINEYKQTVLYNQTYYIITHCKFDESSVETIDLTWKYNPLIPFRLRYLSGDVNEENTGTTSYDIENSIPVFATKIDDNGNYVWRDILPQGYRDPLTGIGVDYPFVNNKRYLFSREILTIVPDTDNDATRNLFDNIWFERYSSVLNINPITNLNDFGKPCL